MRSLNAEVDRNYDFFQRNLASYLVDHEAEFALLRDAELVAFFPTVGEAYRAGLGQFPDEIFSIQQVIDEPVELGFMSLAFV
ncbi:MAG: hypothetical protein H2056_00050 [Sphingopyxis sp.]|nr:hypothetical protein [Sphingopyxis sp.]